MWARIDRTRCQGHARCAAVGRDFYKVDANGFVANEDSPIPPNWKRRPSAARAPAPSGLSPWSSGVRLLRASRDKFSLA